MVSLALTGKGYILTDTSSHIYDDVIKKWRIYGMTPAPLTAVQVRARS